MVEFQPDSAWRGRGAPPVAVPPQVADWADKTYRDNSVWQNPVDDMEPDDVSALLRLLAIHARRKGLKIQHQFYEDEQGRACLRFKMRAKRPYNQPAAPRRLR